MPRTAATAVKRALEEMRTRREERARNTAMMADAGWCWMRRKHPGRSVDDLICDPHEALKLVAHVRKQFPEADAYRICKALMNARKHGGCNVREKR